MLRRPQKVAKIHDCIMSMPWSQEAKHGFKSRRILSLLGSSIKSLHVCYGVSCNGVHALLTIAHREMGYESHAYGLTMADSRQTTQLNRRNINKHLWPIGIIPAWPVLYPLSKAIDKAGDRRSHCLSCHGPGPWVEGSQQSHNRVMTV